MNKLITKVAAGVASASLIATLLAPVAIATDGTLEISGNGNGSTNTILVTTTNDCTVTQKNKTAVLVGAKVTADTGGNTANSNTGGDVTIDTGAATAGVTVTVGGSSNEATDPCCGCQAAPPAGGLISGNGNNSINTITTPTTNTKAIKQKNKTFVGVLTKVKAKTGKNTANSNTGGTTGITSGDATATLDVTVDPSTNTLP